MQLLNNNLKIIYQGFTGHSATYHAELSINYGTNIVGGVTPGKGGTYHLNKPVFNNMIDAVKKTKGNTSLIFVPAKYCKDSILEAIDAKIKTIVCVTEGVPVLDMLYIKKIIKEKNITLIGPNSPGFVIPNKCRAGIMPCDIHKQGITGIVSRSGTLTYEAIKQTSNIGLGQSLSIGIGGDPIPGSDFIDIIKIFNKDKNTKIILLIGEIGGNAEEKAANYIKKYVKKPVLAYIAGIHAPIGKKMGHAGAIIDGGKGAATNKINALKKNGITIINSITDIGETILKEYNKYYDLKITG